MSLLRDVRISKLPERLHQVVHHQRHRSIERSARSTCWRRLDPMLHDVPPLVTAHLRRRVSKSCSWPPSPPGSSSKRLKSSGWGEGKGPRSSPCSSSRAPTPRYLVAVLWLRRSVARHGPNITADVAGLLAMTICSVSCSCRQCMRNRQSRRRFAAPLPWSPCIDMSTTGLELKVPQKRKRTPL